MAFGKDPGQGDLCRCRLLLLGDFAQQIHHRLVGLAVLRGEARNDIAEIGLIEFGFFADLAREKPFSQRTKGNKSDAKFLERRQNLLLRLSPPE